MKISYKKMWILLIEKDISPVTLRRDLNIATGTMTKLRKNEEVALSVLLRICEYLCNGAQSMSQEGLSRDRPGLTGKERENHGLTRIK